MNMYAYYLDNFGNRHYTAHINANASIAHNPNDTIYDYAADKYYLRNLYVIDEYDRLLGLDEIEANFAKASSEPTTSYYESYHRGQAPTSHTTKRGYSPHSGVVKAERIAIEICKEWGIKYRHRFSYDSWDDLEYKKTHKKTHNGRHSTGWKDHKYRHQWEVNSPK